MSDNSQEKTSRYDTATAYPGGYEVHFKRGITSGVKTHTVQVKKGSMISGASGRSLAEAFRNLADKLDDDWNGGPLAPVVWGNEPGEGHE